MGYQEIKKWSFDSFVNRIKSMSHRFQYELTEIKYDVIHIVIEGKVMRVNSFGQTIGNSINDWKAKEYPNIEQMEGSHCRLEKLVPRVHSEDLFNAFCQNNDNNWTYLPYGPFTDFESFNDWLVLSASNSDPLFYSIIDINTNQAVGLVSLLRIDPLMGVVEVGHIHFSDKIQKTLCATQSMYLMMEYVFDVLGYRRYEWKCDDLNLPSKQAAKRLGFQYEGTFRQATIYKGRNRDTSWFAMIDKDWPKIKEAFKYWLRHENFDGQGQQKEKLNVNY